MSTSAWFTPTWKWPEDPVPKAGDFIIKGGAAFEVVSVTKLPKRGWAFNVKQASRQWEPWSGSPDAIVFDWKWRTGEAADVERLRIRLLRPRHLRQVRVRLPGAQVLGQRLPRVGPARLAAAPPHTGEKP